MGNSLLIVDDSPIFRRILKSCVPDDRSYEIVEASNGQEGLDLFLSIRPRITFLDLTMPVMDGVTCLRRIREADPRAVVVISTADVQARSVELVLGLGALSVLKKPPTKERFLEVLTEAEGAAGACP